MTTEESRFIDWARCSLLPADDFESLGGMIGDATLVALTEGIHGGAEPLQLRNRLLRYLVEKKGFTAIALESGIVESRVVHDYVRGGPGDLPGVLEQGLSWTFDKLPQSASMIQWLREYNADPRTPHPVNFYGFDVSGSPGNEKAHRGIDTALSEALRYLARVDASAHQTLAARLTPLTARLRFGTRRFADAPCYEQWSLMERDSLTAGIEDLIGVFERNEGRYIAATTTRDYAWAYRAAIDARQVDAWLRQVPPGWQPLSDPAEYPGARISFLSQTTDVRDRAQAAHLEWILRLEGASGKVLAFAHRYHLSAAPVTAGFWAPDDSEREHEVAGTFLRRWFGERLVTIGHLFGRGEVRCGDFHQVLKPAPRESIDGVMREVGVQEFLLDLRAVPDDIRSWLRREHWHAHGRQVFKLSPREAYDILYYVDAVTPACGMAYNGGC